MSALKSLPHPIYIVNCLKKKTECQRSISPIGSLKYNAPLTVLSRFPGLTVLTTTTITIRTTRITKSLFRVVISRNLGISIFLKIVKFPLLTVRETISGKLRCHPLNILCLLIQESSVFVFCHFCLVWCNIEILGSLLGTCRKV